MRPDPGSFPFTDVNGTVWLSFLDFGERTRERVVVCCHGLTRNGRDFDRLAVAMARDYRVVEIDVVGRGRSGWLADKSAYTMETYLKHVDAFLAYRGLDQVDWIGTSMGGIIGMLLAARPESPIKHLVLNDVGPFVSKNALARIGERVGEDPRFKNMREAAAYLQEVYAGFGPMTELDWSDMTMHSVNRQEDGTYALHYDPAIGEPFKDGVVEDVNIWLIYDKIRCPTLVLRGETSDVLTPETVEEMKDRGPRPTVVEIPDCGHAPSLMAPEQVEIVHDWLRSFDPVPEKEGEPQSDHG